MDKYLPIQMINSFYFLSHWTTAMATTVTTAFKCKGKHTITKSYSVGFCDSRLLFYSFQCNIMIQRTNIFMQAKSGKMRKGQVSLFRIQKFELDYAAS